MRAKRHKAELRSATKTNCSKLKLNVADMVRIQSQNNSPGGERCASAPIPIRSNKETNNKLKAGYHCQAERATVLLPQAPIVPQDSGSMHSSFSLSPLPYREKRSPGSATNERKKGENPVSSFIVRPSVGSISPLTLPPSLHEPCAYIDYPDCNQEKPTYNAQHPSPTSVALPYSSSLKNHLYHDSHDRRTCGASYFILDECVPRSNLYYALEQYDASKKSWSSFDTLTDHEDGNRLSERKAFRFSSPKCIPHIQSWTPSPDF